MFTSRSGEVEHNHRVEIDGNGTGETIDTSKGMPHTHKIKDYKVLPVEGGMDKHIHELSVEERDLNGEADDSKVTHKEGDPPKVLTDAPTKSIVDKVMEKKAELDAEDLAEGETDQDTAEPKVVVNVTVQK